MRHGIEDTSSEIPSTAGRRHILYIDAYDSFSNSIVGLLEQSLDVEVTTVRIDDAEASANLETVLKAFDAVVVGPGPGHPANAKDTGLINQLWALSHAELLPILGICLGFQSLALAFGAAVKRLDQARHGIVSEIHHCGNDIFEDIGSLHATQYHSLHIDTGRDGAEFVDWNWSLTSTCPKLRPLAWDLTDAINGRVLMAIRHTDKPYIGVQFHPESICTSKEGAHMIRNWWQQATEWLITRQRHTLRDRSAALRFISPITASSTFRQAIGINRKNEAKNRSPKLAQMVRDITGPDPVELSWTKQSTGSIDPVELVELLGLDPEDVVLLDSQGHRSGRYSILGVIVPDQTVKVSYRCWDRTLRFSAHQYDEHVIQLDSIDLVWPMLQETLDSHRPKRSSSKEGGGVSDPLPIDCPFWGGFMGYVSYEAGLETIDVELHESSATTETPDVNFAFVHRSVVFDHQTGQTYIQSLLHDDWDWISKVSAKLKSLKRANNLREVDRDRKLDRSLALSHISTPQDHHYRRKVLRCQKSLAAGNSYELCLTDETTITVPIHDNEGLDPWTLYKKLRNQNPAPFGAFLRLPSATVVGTSPERFLKWDRNGHCEFRPIKGTVKKSPDMTHERAHGILNSSKERAENLMIVDLIRHDLSGVVGGQNCSVSKLMTVEEYEHVYQLVSVVEGQLPTNDKSTRLGPTGLDVLKASLPPGSMTGAPKKRSCEILRDIEQRPRGIYSGILGYMDVGGGGDFSVVIRTAVRDPDRSGKSISASSAAAAETSTGSSRYSTPQASSPASSTEGVDAVQSERTETWRIGAGGAVTIQSNDQDEFLEMETKVMSALRAFQPAQN
jgi:para-aminobenzoate synthetase